MAHPTLPGCGAPGPSGPPSPLRGAAHGSSPAVINRLHLLCPWAALWHSSLQTVQLVAARIRASVASRWLLSRSRHPRWKTNMTQSGRNTGLARGLGRTQLGCAVVRWGLGRWGSGSLNQRLSGALRGQSRTQDSPSYSPTIAHASLTPHPLACSSWPQMNR